MRHHKGTLEVICGSMFSGKTEELIRRIRRAVIARQKVQVFKPSIDNRYGMHVVTSHDGVQIEAVSVDHPEKLLTFLDGDTTVVAIDEVQFFAPELISIIDSLLERDIRVIAAGLDTDFRGKPFGIMPQVMCVAEKIQKLQAICVVCGDEACRTQRLVDGKPAYIDDPVILVGAKESYEPRCRRHHEVPLRQAAGQVTSA